MSRSIYKNNIKTKEEFANAFKALSKKKPMNKISISDLITYCHVNRNTFYYHFEDIYALIEWIIENELTPITNSFESKNFNEFLSSVFDYVENNRHLLSSAYSAFGREKLRKELQPYFHETFNSPGSFMFLIVSILSKSSFVTFPFKPVNFLSLSTT